MTAATVQPILRGEAVRPFRMKVRATASEAIEIAVEGELDRSVSAELRALLTGLVGSRARRVVVDLGRCSFLDLGALAVLREAEGRLGEAGQELMVLTSPGQVERLLAVTGVLRGRPKCPASPGGRGEGLHQGRDVLSQRSADEGRMAGRDLDGRR